MPLSHTFRLIYGKVRLYGTRVHLRAKIGIKCCRRATPAMHACGVTNHQDARKSTQLHVDLSGCLAFCTRGCSLKELKPTWTIMGIVPSCLIYVSCAKHSLASKQKNQSCSRPLDLVVSDIVAIAQLNYKNHFPACLFGHFGFGPQWSNHKMPMTVSHWSL